MKVFTDIANLICLVGRLLGGVTVLCGVYLFAVMRQYEPGACVLLLAIWMAIATNSKGDD